MKIFFGVPLRSKQTATDWKIVCDRLYSTIQSIRSNLVPSGYSIKIVICGHEIPDFIKENEYKEVTFIKSHKDIPSCPEEYMLDKGRKKKIIAKHVDSVLEKDEEALFMFFDADDIISSKLIINIIRDFKMNNIDDIAFMRGYIFDLESNKFGFFNGESKIFYRVCGSSYISKVFGGSAFSYLNKLNNHTKFPAISESLGRKVEYSKYPGIAYIVNHGANDVNQRRGDSSVNNLLKRYAVDVELHKYFIRDFGIAL